MEGNGGEVIIRGGTVTATGGKNGAGIGGGLKGNGGRVTISGGTVTTNGGFKGAGIGGGAKNNNIAGGDGGNVIILGGKVEASGGFSASGIGTGFEGQYGMVYVSGGTVSANGGDITIDYQKAGSGIAGGGESEEPALTVSGSPTITVTGGGYSEGYIGNDKCGGSGIHGGICVEDGTPFIIAKGGTGDSAGAAVEGAVDVKPANLLVKSSEDGQNWLNITGTDLTGGIQKQYGRIIREIIPELTVNPITKTYDGSAVTDSLITGMATVNGEAIKGTWSFKGGQTFTIVSDSGEKTVVFTPADSGTYESAEITLTLTINSRAATVKVDDKSKIFGTADPALTASVTGLLGSDTVIYTLTREQGEEKGTYKITPTGNELQGNYKVTYETGTLTIISDPGKAETTPVRDVTTAEGKTVSVQATETIPVSFTPYTGNKITEKTLKATVDTSSLVNAAAEMIPKKKAKGLFTTSWVKSDNQNVGTATFYAKIKFDEKKAKKAGMKKAEIDAMKEAVKAINEDFKKNALKVDITPIDLSAFTQNAKKTTKTRIVFTDPDKNTLTVELKKSGKKKVVKSVKIKLGKKTITLNTKQIEKPTAVKTENGKYSVTITGLDKNYTGSVSGTTK